MTSTPSLTATRKLIVPLFEGQDWTVQNLTTGGEAILVIGPSGTGVLVPNGSMVAVTCDGTNVLPASSSSQSSFVFQPGGTAGPNVYTTWASLYEAISAIVGAYTILVDTRHGAATVPAGAYALGDAPTFLGLTPSTVLTFGAGASISFSSVVFQNLHVVGPAASALASNTATAWNVYFLNCFIAQTLTATTSMFAGNINVTLQSSTFNSSSTKFLDIGTATLLVTLRLLQNMVLIPNLLFNTGGAGVGTIEWDDSCSFSLPNPAGWSYQQLSTVVPTITSPWFNVSNWYIDPANISGTASDSNDGLSAATALLTVAEMIQRYGTCSPQIPSGQNLTIHQLSAQTLNVDAFWFNPRLSGGGQFVWDALTSAPAVGGNFSPTSVTAKVQTAAGNDLKLNGSLPVGVAAGQIIHNISKASYAMVLSVAGGNATVTQPLTLPAPNSFASASEVNSWANTDTYQLYQPQGLNWKNMQPEAGDLTAAGAGGAFWVQGIYLFDASGTPGYSSVVVRPVGIFCTLYACYFEPFVISDGSAANNIIFANCFLSEGAYIFGGRT